MSISKELRAFLQSRGATLVGFADLQGIASDVRDDFPIGISIAVNLNPRIISEIRDGPTKPYYAEYNRVNNLLNKLGQSAARFLRDNRYQAIPLVVASEENPVTLATKLPHKTVATRAGLGWIGKCALLVTKTFGSAVRLTTVLTDAIMPHGNPMDTSLCDDCTLCVDACPGHAPSGRNWQINLHRDNFFNAFVCEKTARKLCLEKIEKPVTICGICIAVCPWTQKYLKQRISNQVSDKKI
jgi:epoxyqueuosine reductase QueG